MTMLQLAKYGIVGLANTVVGYAVIFICLVFLNFSAVISNFIGYMTGLVLSFVLNSLFTFGDRYYSTRKILRYLAVFIFSYLCNLLTLVIFLRLFEFSGVLAQIPSIIVFFIVSFLLNKYFVFTRQH